MRVRYKNGQRGQKMKNSQGKKRVGWRGKVGFSTTETGGASAFRGGNTTFPDYSLDPVCGDPLCLQPVAAFRACLKPPASDRPTQPRFPVPLW